RPCSSRSSPSLPAALRRAAPAAQPAPDRRAPTPLPPPVVSSFSSTLPYQQAARGRSNTLMTHADKQRSQGGKDESIEPIHQSSMAGNEMTCVLGAEAALDRRFKQVAGLGQDRQNTRHYPDDPQTADPARISDHDACRNPPGKTADGAGPGLLRADARPQQGASNGAAAEEGEDVGGPHICEQEDEYPPSPLRIAAQQRGRDQ